MGGCDISFRVSVLVLLLVFLTATNAFGVTYYAPGYAGSTMANGQIYEPGAYTAASPDLPFGTAVEVCWQGCTIVTVTDRCACELDLAYAPAADIGMVEAGWVPATVTVL